MQCDVVVVSDDTGQMFVRVTHDILHRKGNIYTYMELSFFESILHFLALNRETWYMAKDAKEKEPRYSVLYIACVLNTSFKI